MLLYFYELLPEEEAEELRKRDVDIDEFCSEVRKSENNPRTYDRFIFDWWKRYRTENGMVSAVKKVSTNSQFLKSVTNKPDSIDSIDKILPLEKLLEGQAIIEQILADFSDDLRIDEIENLSKLTELSVFAIQQIVRNHKIK